MARLVLLTLVFCFLCTGAATAAEDWRTLSVADFTPTEPRNYGAGLAPAASIHDAVFYSGEQLPKAGELTAAEKFIIAGGTLADGGSRDWLTEVTMVCRAYESRFKTIPQQLTPDVLAAVFRCSEEEAATFSFFKNQLTGEWLRCDAKEPSAGDIYLRRLSTQEAIHTANVPGGNGNLYMLLRGQTFNINGKEEEEHLIGDVWYCRAYGEGGRVILTYTPMISAPGRS